ncbi:MAG TPA: redoxin domain-containing protein, partial [Ginsengibacter sp.]|nr:redoxin domain-containing protein [Ginsengibacter sp.]
FTIVAFWDPDCGHCKKEIPRLAEVYHKMKKDGIDIETYSVGIFDIAATVLFTGTASFLCCSNADNFVFDLYKEDQTPAGFHRHRSDDT